ncbi:hypothetical protein RYX36_027350 [Vicia faba]
MERVIVSVCFGLFTRKQLMLSIAEMVPRHHGRTKKQETSSASTATAGPSNKSGKGYNTIHFFTLGNSPSIVTVKLR